MEYTSNDNSPQPKSSTRERPTNSPKKNSSESEDSSPKAKLLKDRGIKSAHFSESRYFGYAPDRLDQYSSSEPHSNLGKYQQVNVIPPKFSPPLFGLFGDPKQLYTRQEIDSIVKDENVPDFKVMTSEDRDNYFQSLRDYQKRQQEKEDIRKGILHDNKEKPQSKLSNNSSRPKKSQDLPYFGQNPAKLDRYCVDKSENQNLRLKSTNKKINSNSEKKACPAVEKENFSSLFNHEQQIKDIFNDSIKTGEKIASSRLARSNDYELLQDPAIFRLSSLDQKQLEENILCNPPSKIVEEKLKTVNNASIYYYQNKVNGKTYIGKSENSLNQRFSEHRSDMNRPEEKRGHFMNSMRHYGENSFTKHLLHPTSEFPRWALSEMEKNYIARYQTYSDRTKGLNSTPGGDGYVHSKEKCEEMSEERKGEGNPFWNQHHTLASREKISQGNTGKVINQDQKEQISQTKIKNFKKEHPIANIDEFERDLGNFQTLKELQTKYHMNKSSITTWSKHCFGKLKFSENQLEAAQKYNTTHLEKTYGDIRQAQFKEKYPIDLQTFRNDVESGKSIIELRENHELTRSATETYLKYEYGSKNISEIRKNLKTDK
jgi:group I intron endonuclease